MRGHMNRLYSINDTLGQMWDLSISWFWCPGWALYSSGKVEWWLCLKIVFFKKNLCFICKWVHIFTCTHTHTPLHEAMDLLVSLIAISIISHNRIYFHLILISLGFSGFSVLLLDSLSSDLCSAVGWQMCRPFFLLWRLELWCRMCFEIHDRNL